MTFQSLSVAADAAEILRRATQGDPAAYIRQSPTETELGERFQTVIETLGFAHFIYSVVDSARLKLYLICCTYRDEVRRIWADAQVYQRDPLIAHVVKTVAPLRRTDFGDDGAWAQDLFDCLHRNDIHSPSWHMPVHDNTTFVGLYSIAPRFSDVERHGIDYYRDVELLLPALCLEAHGAWTRLTGGAGKAGPSLKPQEVEILRWLSHGKSTEDIAVIMEITERTVNYHVTKIKAKLGVDTRAHAVARAMRKGFI